MLGAQIAANSDLDMFALTQDNTSYVNPSTAAKFARLNGLMGIDFLPSTQQIGQSFQPKWTPTALGITAPSDLTKPRSIWGTAGLRFVHGDATVYASDPSAHDARVETGVQYWGPNQFREYLSFCMNRTWAPMACDVNADTDYSAGKKTVLARPLIRLGLANYNVDSGWADLAWAFEGGITVESGRLICNFGLTPTRIKAPAVGQPSLAAQLAALDSYALAFVPDALSASDSGLPADVEEKSFLFKLVAGGTTHWYKSPAKDA